MPFVVEPVTTSRQKKQFLNLPWAIYRDYPNWVPPLRMNQKELVGYAKNPFYDDAEAQTFLAYRDGTIVGRVAAILNHAYNTFQHEQRGFFGFFESVNDQEVASALLDAVRSWFKARSIEAIRGPVNPSLNHECGLLVEGFDKPPTFMMTYNPPYYGELIERAGFRKVQDLYAFWGPVTKVAGLDKKLAFIVQTATERFNIHVRPMDRTRFQAEVEMFLRLYNESLPGTWGFSPMSPAEIKHVSKSLKFLIDPELAVVAEIEGKPIGAVFGLPDYNPRIKAIDGRLFPFGFLTLLSKRRGFKRMRVLSANVIPEWQRWGVGLVLMRGLLPRIFGSGIEEVEFSWVLESNHLSRATLEKGGAEREKTYRLYDTGPEAKLFSLPVK